ncbi:MAG TPA: hypothetical protein VMP00_14955 [Burkholderiales bacterium]|nr:hypothetical protein [Burkholderiales bacterium]
MDALRQIVPELGNPARYWKGSPGRETRDTPDRGDIRTEIAETYPRFAEQRLVSGAAGTT